MPAWRCESADDFGRRLTSALALDALSLIVVPIDYSLDVGMSERVLAGGGGGLSASAAPLRVGCGGRT
jgi:hypothetical protein